MSDYQNYLDRKKTEINLGVGEMIARGIVIYPMVFVLAYTENRNIYVAFAWLLLSIIGTGLAAYATARYAIYGNRWKPLTAEEYAEIEADVARMYATADTERQRPDDGRA